MATNESDLLGRLAEQEFGTWALRKDITVNKVGVDRHGWDFILQIPYRPVQRASIRSLDKIGPELSCKIQVKATEQIKNSCDDINLENWARMIAEPIPWFVAILIYESRNLKEAFLVHVDEKLMSRALTRLRQVPDSEKDTLHKKFMSLSWSEDEKILPPFDEGLIQRISNSVGTGMFEYVDRKKRLYQTLGYTDKAFQGSITFKAPNSDDPSSLYNALADHALGLNESMPVTLLNLSEVRFGIPKRDLSISGKPDNCRIEDPKVDSGTISFYNTNQPTRSVEIECSFYHAGIVFPFLPKEFHRIKIKTRFFSIMIDPNDIDLQLKMQISISTEQSEPMQELLKYARFVIICSEGSDANVKFKLTLGKNLDLSGKEFSINSSFPDEMVTTAKAIEQLWDIMRFFDIDKDNKISLNEIWNQDETIKFFHNAIDINPSHPDGLITFKANAGVSEQQAAFVLGSYIVIGNYAVAVIVAFIGDCKSATEESERSVTDDAGPMQRYQILNISKELSRKEKYLWREGTTINLSAMLEEACQSLAKRVPIVMAPQLARDDATNNDPSLP